MFTVGSLDWYVGGYNRRESVDCRAIYLSVDTRSILGRQSVDNWSTVGRQSVNSRSTVGRYSDQLSAEYKWMYERYGDMIDHRSYVHNLSSCEIKTWKTNLDLSGIRSHDLCDTGFVSVWIRTLR